MEPLPNQMQVVPSLDELQVVPGREIVPVVHSIADRNKDLLTKRANKISEHLNPSGTADVSIFFSWLPSFETIGRTFGYAGAKTHGASLSNFFVSAIYKKTISTPQIPKTLWDRFWVSAASPAFEESAKMVITPIVLPFIEVGCVAAGGLVLPAAAMLASMLVQRIVGAANTKYTLDKLPELEELVTCANGQIIDANGNAIDAEDLKELREVVQQYNLLCRLLVTPREEVDMLLSEYIKYNDGSTALFCNGLEIDEKQQQIIEKACNALKRENFVGDFNDNNKFIIEMIKMLTQNMPTVKESTYTQTN